jgi:hypothetical protein
MLYLYFLSAGPVVSCLNSSTKLLSRSGVHELIVHNDTSEFRSISNYYLSRYLNSNPSFAAQILAKTKYRANRVAATENYKVLSVKSNTRGLQQGSFGQGASRSEHFAQKMKLSL